MALFFLVFSKRCISAQPVENGWTKRWEQIYQNVSQVLPKTVYMYTWYEVPCFFHLSLLKLFSPKVQLNLSVLFESHWTGYFWKLWAPKKGQMSQQKETGNKSGQHNKTTGRTRPLQVSVCVSAPISLPSSVHILKLFSALDLCLHCR